MRKTYNPLLIIIFFICYWTTASAGQYVQVSSDLEIYYEEAGTGRPLIFVTGWTGTNEFFTQDQFPYFSKKYRVLAYDPRGQGRSSKTLEGHTYIQHGKDLRAFLDALKLKDPVIVGWSNGCTEVYGYFRTYGVDGIKAFVCIDESPGIAGKGGEQFFVRGAPGQGVHPHGDVGVLALKIGQQLTHHLALAAHRPEAQGAGGFGRAADQGGGCQGEGGGLQQAAAHDIAHQAHPKPSHR